MEKISVILISSVRPEPTSGGQIILHRHLVNQPGIELKVYGEEPKGFHWTAIVRRLVGKFEQIINAKLAGDFWAWWEGRWIDPFLPKRVDSGRPTVVMTVAHGEGFMAALRFARKHQLPLVSFFQDWWPDMAPVHSFSRKRLETMFRQLAEESAVIFCVSEGMKEALALSQGTVLPPIPAAAKPGLRKNSRNQRSDGKFRVLYFGNLGEYGPMLGDALKALQGNERVELVVRGSQPKWPKDFAEKMKRQEKWLEFAPRSELEEWLESAGAFLIPMVFDPSMRRRMETSFPSKLVEFAQFGKPLVVWGPGYCSAVEWASRADAAVCVNDADPSVLVVALEKLAGDKELQKRYAAKAAIAAANEFDHERIRQLLHNILMQSLASKP